MNTLGLFGKHPRPGHVKTRLATEMGDDAATKLYAAFINDLAFRFRATGDRRVFGYWPRDATPYFSQFEKLGYELWPQPEGELDWKIISFFHHALSSLLKNDCREPQETSGFRHTDGSAGASPSLFQQTVSGPASQAEQGRELGSNEAVVVNATSDQDCRAVLIGTDSPTLPIEFIQQAFDMLRDVDCVLGPATDGGYYLIGLRRPAPLLFEQMAWSGPNVLRQTVQRASALGLTLGLLPPWYDIDNLADLQMLAGHIRAMTHAGQTHPCPVTAAALEQLRLLDRPAHSVQHGRA